MTITLLGEPKSTSHIYHYHCKFGRPSGYVTAEGKALKESYQWQAKSQWKRKPLCTPLQASVTLFFGTKRRQDIDNFSKVFLDALTGILYEDDSQIMELTLMKAYDPKNPRIVISINELP